MDSTAKRKAAQSFPLVTALFHDPLIVHGLSQGERCLMGYLTYLVWQRRDLEVRASAGFLRDNTGQSLSSVKRHLAGLIDVRLVRVARTGRYPAKTPNWYLVEPIFLAEHKWKGHPATATRPAEKPIENLAHSLFFNMVQKGPCGTADYWSKIENWVQKEPRDSSKRTMWEKLLGTSLVQKELQIYLLYSFLVSRAPRYSPKDVDAVRQGEFGIEVPGVAGRDHQTAKPKQKGVGRSADSIEEIGRRAGARAQKESAENSL